MHPLQCKGSPSHLRPVPEGSPVQPAEAAPDAVPESLPTSLVRQAVEHRTLPVSEQFPGEPAVESALLLHRLAPAGSERIMLRPNCRTGISSRSLYSDARGDQFGRGRRHADQFRAHYKSWRQDHPANRLWSPDKRRSHRTGR